MQPEGKYLTQEWSQTGFLVTLLGMWMCSPTRKLSEPLTVGVLWKLLHPGVRSYFQPLPYSREIGGGGAGGENSKYPIMTRSFWGPTPDADSALRSLYVVDEMSETNSHGLPKSCGEKGMVLPLSEREREHLDPCLDRLLLAF